jgi:hypothetical protein
MASLPLASTGSGLGALSLGVADLSLAPFLDVLRLMVGCCSSSFRLAVVPVACSRLGASASLRLAPLRSSSAAGSESSTGSLTTAQVVDAAHEDASGGSSSMRMAEVVEALPPFDMASWKIEKAL